MPFKTDTDTTTVLETQEQVDHDVPWHVVVFNDPVNLMGFVTLVLRRIFGYSEEEATRLMLEVHHLGRSVVWTGAREKAEHYVQELQSYQLLAAMRKAAE